MSLGCEVEKLYTYTNAYQVEEGRRAHRHTHTHTLLW